MSEVPKSELLLLIKVHLKLAMMEEVRLRKATLNEPSGKEFDQVVAHKTVSRAIISMFPELGIKPDQATDDDVIKLVKKYINQERERNIYQFGYLKEKDIDGKSAAEVKKLITETIAACGDELDSPVIKIAKEYLPEQASMEEIVAWIKDNIDFTKYKNKMQAMGPIMKQFKGADGNFVKEILLSM